MRGQQKNRGEHRCRQLPRVRRLPRSHVSRRIRRPAIGCAPRRRIQQTDQVTPQRRREAVLHSWRGWRSYPLPGWVVFPAQVRAVQPQMCSRSRVWPQFKGCQRADGSDPTPLTSFPMRHRAASPRYQRITRKSAGSSRVCTHPWGFAWGYRPLKNAESSLSAFAMAGSLQPHAIRRGWFRSVSGVRWRQWQRVAGVALRR